MNETTYVAHAPQDMNAVFAAAFNSGDIDHLLALYESEGQLVRQDGQVDVGLDAVRAHLQGFLQLGGQMVSTNVYALVSGDLALLRAHWRLTTWAENRAPIELEGHTAEVVRRQSDGRWLYVLDHPFGADPL